MLLSHARLLSGSYSFSFAELLQMSEQTKNHMTTAREVVANARVRSQGRRGSALPSFSHKHPHSPQTLLAIGKFVKKKLATGGASDRCVVA